MVSILDAWGFGFDNTEREEVPGLAASAARSGGRYLTTFGNGVTGLEGTGNEFV
jgi:hypothetical protein